MKGSPPSKRAALRGDSALPQDERSNTPSLIDLITLQWQRERGDLDLQNFLLSIYLVRLGMLLDRASDRYCKKQFGINGGDMRLLFALRRSGPPYVKRPTDLFRALLVTSSAITKKVDRLEKAGFVERSTDVNHNGGFLVHLTKRGLHVVEEATEHLANHSALAPAMARLSPEARKQGSDFALCLISELEQTEADISEEGSSAVVPPPGRQRR